jgi:cellulose biosynthesis protein BcsQ
VLDVPAGRSPLLPAALAVADVVLSIVLADAASLATLPAFERLVAAVRGGRHPAWTVVNQTDATRPLARDAALATDALVAGRRVPASIPADEAVREALARQRTVLDEAVASQAVAAIWSVASWIEAAISGEDGKESGRVVVMAGAR